MIPAERLQQLADEWETLSLDEAVSFDLVPPAEKQSVAGKLRALLERVEEQAAYFAVVRSPEAVTFADWDGDVRTVWRGPPAQHTATVAQALRTRLQWWRVWIAAMRVASALAGASTGWGAVWAARRVVSSLEDLFAEARQLPR
jgi:hypothetical protein